MSTSPVDKAIPLPANYYLFGVYFPATRSQSGKDEKISYPNWHAETSLIENQEITNVRPLARVPLLNVTDSDKPELWATRHDFKLSQINHGQPDEHGVYEALKPESPIHVLGSPIAKSEIFGIHFPAIRSTNGERRRFLGPIPPLFCPYWQTNTLFISINTRR
ncbi:hypothetical protein ABS858_08460 [Vibrio neptunius]|uniref:hypothetical protein n=1 Tax=Vibrio neptunius TaxID=170651 RepID=UPI00331539EE